MIKPDFEQQTAAIIERSTRLTERVVPEVLRPNIENALMAAYAAGQRAMRERAAERCAIIAREASDRHVALCVPGSHVEQVKQRKREAGVRDGAAQCMADIRALEVEHG